MYGSTGNIVMPGLKVTNYGDHLKFNDFSLKDFKGPYKALTGTIEVKEGRYIWDLTFKGGPVTTLKMDTDYKKFKGYGRKELTVIVDNVELDVLF